MPPVLNVKERKKDKPILGMDILSGLTKDDDEWNGGTILDPKNGKEYKCYIKLLDNNTLKLRGYIGFSLIGRTALWKRADLRTLVRPTKQLILLLQHRYKSKIAKFVFFKLFGRCSNEQCHRLR